jgi:hypothetical protein
MVIGLDEVKLAPPGVPSLESVIWTLTVSVPRAPV